MPRVRLCATVALALALFASAAHADEATTTTTTTTPPPREQPPATDDDPGFGIGAMGGVGFPRPLSVEGFVTVDKLVLVGAEYSVLPMMNIGGVDTRLSAVAIDARVFPFRGGFFIGVRGGRQAMSLTGTLDLGALGATTESLDVSTWFVNPRVGFLWTWKPGLVVGIDAGLQLPVSVTSTTTLDTGLGIESTLTRAGDTFGRAILPTVDLLKIGLVF